MSFTGFLIRPRSEAMAAARKAGAIVQSKPGPSTDVLVRGRPNALQIAGTAGAVFPFWSPDSRYLVYSEVIEVDGGYTPQVSVIDVSQPASNPIKVADGVFGVWSFE